MGCLCWPIMPSIRACASTQISLKKRHCLNHSPPRGLSHFPPARNCTQEEIRRTASSWLKSRADQDQSDSALRDCACRSSRRSIHIPETMKRQSHTGVGTPIVCCGAYPSRITPQHNRSAWHQTGRPLSIGGRTIVAAWNGSPTPVRMSASSTAIPDTWPAFPWSTTYANPLRPWLNDELVCGSTCVHGKPSEPRFRLRVVGVSGRRTVCSPWPVRVAAARLTDSLTQSK